MYNFKITGFYVFKLPEDDHNYICIYIILIIYVCMYVCGYLPQPNG